MKNLILYFTVLSMSFTSSVNAVNQQNQANNNSLIESHILTRADVAGLNVNNRNVTIPNGKIAIDSCAFRLNGEISSVTTNYDLKRIGQRSFESSSIERITLYPNLLKISNYAFANCRNLSEIRIPDSVQIIGRNAFNNSGISVLSVPGHFMVTSDYDYDNNVEIYIEPMHNGTWRNKIMTLQPGDELTVTVRRGGRNQEAITYFRNDQ